MFENTTKYHSAAKGAAKRGPALLAGLLRCARCGRKLHVGYSGHSGRVLRYNCRGGNINHGVPMCQSFGGLRPDEAVAAVVLDPLQPLDVQAALQAWESACQEHDLKTRASASFVEKARYEAERVRRQFELVDPANRLVAAELESRWNARLGEVEQAEQKLQAAQSVQRPVTEAERQRLCCNWARICRRFGGIPLHRSP